MTVDRAIVKQMLFFKDKYPILALTGPRQSGKTTLLKEVFPDYTYLSLENPDLRAFAENDPNGFFEKYSKYCIFDEVQRVPQLFSYLQNIVDDSKIMGQFILSGSQNFHLINNIAQSLAGRVALFKLLPFDFNEMKSANLLSNDYIKAMIKGFYPAIYDRDIPAGSFYSNYIQTYVERDITELINIRDIRTFRTFLSLCASRAGQLLNLNSLANDCGITQPTAKAWISVLESSYILFLLQPHHKNYDKRVIKSPKLYFYDTGLLCHLLKIKDENQVKFNSYIGHLFENMIVSEYVKQNYHQNLMKEFWFWRDSAGHEVDLISQDDDLLDVIEIKATATVSQDLFKGLLYFENLAKDNVRGKTLVYAGLDNQKRTIANVISWYDLK
ncbi:putative AAA+ superfamily ATPase [Flavobacterium sp. CG_23.5]|uniref:ATP-binding protein n=1 Tax=unclassified Flavobacterium TaxID=196869 RepID=UPI0018C98C38|nr:MULTISPECIES: ATP-binding protein [unclassified Flavobacterium]MBG6112233.1 putative AAA+ superfamily ATPase [Flavobacterium sp. CG_9.10]MBP2281770.1 putative AAA+ superfamily ATPase [Flavobacterium sp. CG_23.5]